MNLFSKFIGEPVPTYHARELQEKLQSDRPPFLVDVRQPEEYHLGHIPGARLIPLGELNRRLTEIPQDREIVCICATGHRSVPAAHTLKRAGYSVAHLKTGMMAWVGLRLPVKKGDQL